MTTTKATHRDVVVVDGSNIATEGRSIPSLAQLNEAVLSFRDEFPDATVTVVVDATFGHRIDKSEVKQFDEAVAHNELVAPPAGAIGRGDAFVLSIANKVGARILSNDSFQEFHGDYPWLFDEGRLIGGKPVPHVGWVFVERLPVKGPTSRKATRAARNGGGEPKTVRRTASREASLPMPVPTAPPPGAPRSRVAKATATPASGGRTPKAVSNAPAATVATTPAPTSGAPVNELMPFLDFVEHHPVGSSVNGVVESYSSHGAYVQIGDLRGYVPLRLMSDPPPRSAREVMRVGDAVTLVVTSYAPARRSVDLAVPAAVQAGEIQPVPELDVIVEAVESATPAPATRRKRAARAAAPPAPEPAGESEPVAAAPAKKATAKKAPAKRAAKKVAAPVEPVEANDASTPDPAPAPAPAKRSRAKKTAPADAEPAPAERSTAKKAPAKKAAAKKAAAPRPRRAAATATATDDVVSPAARRRRRAKEPET